MAMSTVVVSMLWAGLLRQQPSSTWKPNFEPLGMFCYKNSKNPNIPPSRQHDFPHSGGCGCENTQFRWIDGEMYDKTTGVPDLQSPMCTNIYILPISFVRLVRSVLHSRSDGHARLIARTCRSIVSSRLLTLIHFNCQLCCCNPFPPPWLAGWLNE